MTFYSSGIVATLMTAFLCFGLNLIGLMVAAWVVAPRIEKPIDRIVQNNKKLFGQLPARFGSALVWQVWLNKVLVYTECLYSDRQALRHCGVPSSELWKVVPHRGTWIYKALSYQRRVLFIGLGLIALALLIDGVPSPKESAGR